jgi:hypothetical protein
MDRLALDPLTVACFNAFWTSRQSVPSAVQFAQDEIADLLITMISSDFNEDELSPPSYVENGPASSFMP